MHLPTGMMENKDRRGVGQGSQHRDAGDGILAGATAGVAIDGGAQAGAEELLRDAAGVEAGHWGPDESRFSG